ncbi:hypothetical protein L226DRAFT_565424 [Lentinus tigrinus ALCF2SS1-7]|uniref:BED-type domain-containing protein n=1 Tax=Lentinus tigrinus ALCF2SS1-6 TaxID=1328759 RepID=A0A5C2SLF9_9APHY|nr:hypothetical protein L227DRAFT_607242 [Lentinus tigrinus ALCF2SS1-6]RPD82916.1 hypothetical protein L226DRAFT_565424 [Lentinus tigrinus ALCF2SS1-7]
MHGRGRSFTNEPALNVTYVFDSDEERERSRSPLSGSTAVQEPTPRRAERDSTYVPADDEGSDEDMYDGPTPSSYRKRPREEMSVGGEGQTAPKSARVGGKQDQAHQAGASTSASSSKTFPVPGPTFVRDNEEENREYIYVSSDGEVKPEQSSSPMRKKKRFKLAHRHTLPSVMLPPHKKSTGKEPAKKSGPVFDKPSLPVPSWFEDALHGIRRSFPTANMTVFCHEESCRWGVKCHLCDPPRELLVGPGSSLYNFRQHLTGIRHRLEPEATAGERTTSKAGQPAGAAAPSRSHANREAAPPRTPKKRKANVEDVVERFLKEMGLTGELADALRHVGISDEARMKALGQLSDALLDRLEKSLAEEGLDLSACLLVREGLKRRATAP